MVRRRRYRWISASAGAVALLLGLAWNAKAGATDLVIAVQAEANSIDPHYYVGGQDNQVRFHLFDSLVDMDLKQSVVPSLAKSWRLIDPTTWEFKLRDDVFFHNGEKFTANDVVYTVCRIRNFKEALSSYARYTAAIKNVAAPDPYTLIVSTAEPYPALLNELSTFSVLNAKTSGFDGTVLFDDKNCGVSAWPKSADFSTGALAVGTGPYTFVDYVPGGRLVLAANPRYWRGKPDWTKVTLRPIASSAARIAALLSGDVDIIDSPPPQDIERLKSNPSFKVTAGPSQTLLYLQFQHRDEPAPGIVGTGGKNPFRDGRVRAAVSQAIDRQAIVERIMRGYAQVATNVMGPDYFGFDPAIKPDRFDVAAAKALLAQAGYPEGFEVLMGATNDRYSNDAKIAEAVAQMLAKIGVKVTLEESRYAVFVKKWQGSQYPLFQTGLAVNSVDMAQTLRALVGTEGAAPGFGAVNYGHYSNPAFDDLVKRATIELDAAKRMALLQQANALLMRDHGILALMHPMNVWAHKKTIALDARNDNATVAMSAHPAK